MTVLLTLFGGGCIVGNYATVIAWYVRHKYGSLVPLMGGMTVAFALWFCPLPGIRLWAWIPLVVDLGCLYLFASCLYHFVFKKRDDKPAA
jgi:hypothetical protein